MLKRLTCLAALTLAPLTLAPMAQASPGLAKVWGDTATHLYGETLTLLETESNAQPRELEADYVNDLESFAIVAARLAEWNDVSEGPADLGCIFRGMAEEADLQLQTLVLSNESAEREAALHRLISMFDDAHIIAEDAIEAARANDASYPGDGIPVACTADADLMQRLLAE